MNSYFSSTLFKKFLSATSGLFLVLFLIGHLAGNLQLILPLSNYSQKQFNEYAFFMTTNPVIKILSYFTYASILLHSFISILLSIKSNKSRPISYAVAAKNKNSSWPSRNMPLLGVCILFFIIVHLKSFWYEMHFGFIGNDAWGNKDLYTITITAFHELWYVLFYVISIFIIGLHLFHGIESGFQTIGIINKKIFRLIQLISKILVFFITILFSIIPIILYFRA